MMDKRDNPRLLGIDIPSVRLVWTASDELHIYMDALGLFREDVARLVVWAAECRADEATIEDDHVRLWWD